MNSPKSGLVNVVAAWVVIILLLAFYIGISSFLGLIVFGPVGIIVAWSLSLAADVVFVVGSITAAFVGVVVAKSARGSVALTAVITWVTYCGAAWIASRASATLGGGGPQTARPDNLPDLGIVMLNATRFGLVGLAFAAVIPALARKRVKRLLTAHAEPLS